MTIAISAEAEARLRALAEAAGVAVENYVERLIEEDSAWGEVVGPDDPEFTEIRAAVTEGLDQARRGEGRPATVVFAKLREKHGIPR